MRVKCVFDTGSALAEVTIESGELRRSVFDVDIGAVYTVYAILTWKGGLDYLLSKGITDRPFWYPAELFEVADKLLPLEWYFNFIRDVNPENKNPHIAFWGYKEMAYDSRHHIDLIEREPEALDIFFKRKREIDEYHDLSKFIRKAEAKKQATL